MKRNRIESCLPLSPPAGWAGQRACLVARGLALAALALLLLLPGGIRAQTRPNTSADADIASGIQLMRAGNFAEAKVKFTAAARANPHSADALTWRGICENRLKQYHEALQDLQAALRIDPQAQPARYNLALTQIRLGQTDAAIDELETFVQARPDAAEAQYNLAVLLESKHSIAKAVDHLKAADQAQPGDLGIAQHLLMDDLALGDSAEAQRILQRLQAESTPPNAQLQIGTALLEAARFTEAAALIKSARSRLPASKDVDLLLARAYIGSQEDFEAIHLLKPSEHQDTTGNTAYLIGLAYGAAGATQEAIEAFQTAAKVNPRDPRPLFHLGVLYSSMPGQRNLAFQNLREAVRLDPHNASYAIGLARLLLEADRSKDALDVLERVHTEGVEAAEHDLLLGIAQVTTNGVAVAIPTLERAIELDPSLALSHNVLGFCYFRQGNYAQAAQAYQRASDLSPATLIFAYDAALAFERANKIDDALTYAKRAVSLPSARADDHYLVGKLYAKAGRQEEAIHELKLAVQMNPDFDDSYYLLARTYMRMGDAAQAAGWNAKLTALKQKHDQSYAAQKNSQSSGMTSSSLLHGASLPSEKDEDLKR